MTLDLLLVGGTVVDGTGRPRYVADVGVVGERVEAIGHLADAEARRRIDAAGTIVAPGFVDLHSHSEWTIIANPGAESSIRQGVTTEVLGNCGFSSAPTDAPATVTPLVPPFLRDLVAVDWTGFGQYLERIESGRPAINVAHLVGHHALRLTAISFDARPPTAEEQASMEASLERALEEGAFGLSFGLEYAPGLNATTDELVGLAGVVARHGGLVAIHMRNQEDHYLEAIDEALQMTRAHGVNLQLSHIPPHRGTPPDAWPRALALVEREVERGLPVGFDAHPYLWGGTVLSSVLPRWAFEGGPTAILERLARPEVRQAIKASPPEMLRAVKAGEWDRFILTYTKASRHLVGKTLAEIAEELERPDPYDAVFDILIAEGDDLFGALWVTELIEPDVQREILQHPATIVESDGMALAVDGPLGHVGWHPRCFGWTARLLGEHVRERGVLSLEEAVHKITLKPARKAGLAGRGALEPGGYADLVVFDERTVHDNATYRQPARYPSGFEYVVVNGEIALERGDRSPRRAGKVLRPIRTQG